MKCIECEKEIRSDNKSGLCQKHLIKKMAHEYYVNLRKQHKCLRCKADIQPVIINGVEVFRQLCEIHRTKLIKTTAERTDEQKLHDREYRRNYQKTEKYKAYLSRSDVKERLRKYQIAYRLRKKCQII